MVTSDQVGLALKKASRSGYRCGEVDIRRQKDVHVFDDKRRHGADGEKAEFFDSRCTRPQAIWINCELSEETWSGIVRPLISKSRSIRVPMKSGCAPYAATEMRSERSKRNLSTIEHGGMCEKEQPKVGARG